MGRGDEGETKQSRETRRRTNVVITASGGKKNQLFRSFFLSFFLLERKLVESVWKLIEGVTEAAQAGEEKMSSRRNQWFVLQVGEKFAQDAHGTVFAGSQEEKLIKTL